MKIPELLAPAGSMASLKVAINSGADAVYISGYKFGARHYAENFTPDEITMAVEYAHLRNVKVYLTVNTIILEDELDEAIEYLISLYGLGVDGVLMQDTGLVKLTREIIPDLEIHASTQMNIHNLDGLKWAKSLGIKRVVLAREVSFSDLKRMGVYARSNDIELEVFVQGALCYSYSGHCLMSSFIGGRSGNRGMCAQPCRRTYELKSSNGELGEGYLLSPRDLSLYTSLDKLMDLGVSSFKIEGRMRSLEYVAVSVKTYKDALVKLGDGFWKADNREVERLKLAFNRGFTKGNLFDSSADDMMSRDSPSDQGLFVGLVKSYNNKDGEVLIHIQSDIFPEEGDGILIKNHDGDVGLTLRKFRVKNKTLYLKHRKIEEESRVYLNKKRSFSDWSHELLNEKVSYVDKSRLSVSFSLDDDNYPILKGDLDSVKNFKLRVKGSVPFEKAINRPISERQIRKQLSKLDKYPYVLDKLTIHYGGDLFTPLSELNKLRRALLEQLTALVINSYKPSQHSVNYVKDRFSEYKNQLKPVDSGDKSVLGLYVNTIGNLKDISDLGFYDKVYFEVPVKGEYDKDYIVKVMDEVLSLRDELDFELVWKWPDITRDSILNELKTALKELKNKYDSIPLMIGSPVSVKERIAGSIGLNISNHQSMDSFQGFESLTVSPEISLDNIKSMKQYSTTELELVVQGFTESMISRTSILPGAVVNDSRYQKYIMKDSLMIKDCLGAEFQVKETCEHGSIVLNSVELCLIDYVKQLRNLGVYRFIVDARWRKLKYIKSMGDAYSQVLFSNGNIKAVKKQIKKECKSGITTGNFVKRTIDNYGRKA